MMDEDTHISQETAEVVVKKSTGSGGSIKDLIKNLMHSFDIDTPEGQKNLLCSAEEKMKIRQFIIEPLLEKAISLANECSSSDDGKALGNLMKTLQCITLSYKILSGVNVNLQLLLARKDVFHRSSSHSGKVLEVER